MGWLKLLKSKLLIARQLSLREWLILVEAWWTLLVFYLALRWLSYDRLKTSLRPTREEKADPARVLAFAQRLQKLVYLASRLHQLSMTCLVKVFALGWMLARRGIPVQLRIGANKASEEIHAHAWVEIGGQPIGESEDITERFKVLDSVGREIP